MKLLITGGCGFLGSNLAAEALERGLDLFVFDNLSKRGAAENLAWLQSMGRFSFINGDIRSSDVVSKHVKSIKPDVVFHLAGQVAMTASIVDPRLDFEVNALGTLNVLEAIRLHAPEAAVICSSTNKVYGDLEQFTYRETATRYECIEFPAGFDESIPLNFHSPYGCSKGAADQYMLDYARIFGLKTVVFRHSSMYGGRQFATYDQGWVGWFCQQALNSKSEKITEPFTISGSGKQVRDVIHSNDVARLYFTSLERINEVQGQAMNIGGGISNSLSLLELFSLLEKTLAISLHYKKLPARHADQRVFVADIRKTRQLLGWTPIVGVHDGIAQQLRWIEEAGLIQ